MRNEGGAWQEGRAVNDNSKPDKDNPMSKKNNKNRPDDAQREMPWLCENESGGLGIQPCTGNVATCTAVVDMEFTGLDTRTLFLCDECAEALRDAAEAHGYEV
jgi:hypothetical protein